jgi:hypothetical protein
MDAIRYAAGPQMELLALALTIPPILIEQRDDYLGVHRDLLGSGD